MRYHEWLHAVVYCPRTEAVDPWLAKEAQAGAGEADGGVKERAGTRWRRRYMLVEARGEAADRMWTRRPAQRSAVAAAA